jgi:ACS family glucarate transporter-like MFS transporter
MDRVNLSVAAPMIMTEFKLSKIQLGMLQTLFFVAYSAMQIPGGLLAEWFKPRVVIAGAVTWWSFFTALTASCSSFTGLGIVRTLFGLGEGPLFPAFGTFFTRWFPTKEKGRATSLMLAGAYVGPVVGPSITVAIMTAVGWRPVFWVYGIVGILFAAVWYFLARVSPKDSRYVNQAELAFIEEGVSKEEFKAKVAPWKRFLRSTQFWAIGIQYFINDYIKYVYLTWLPLYFLETQGFSLKAMGVAASFPWIALTTLTIATGWSSDFMIKAGASKRQARSYLAISGLLFSSSFLYLGAAATNPTLNVLWLTLSLGSLGLTSSASWSAALDIGGEYGGSVVAWMNFWGNMGGVAAPITTAWVVTAFGWQKGLLVTAASAVLGAAVWLMVKPDIPLVQNTRGSMSAEIAEVR